MKFLPGLRLTAIKNDKKTSIRGIVILNDDAEMNLKNFQKERQKYYRVWKVFHLIQKLLKLIRSLSNFDLCILRNKSVLQEA